MKGSSCMIAGGLLGLLVLAGCATSPTAVKEFQTGKNFPALIAYLGEPVEESNTQAVAMQKDVLTFILENKEEAKPAVIQALSKGPAKARGGAAKTAWEWADHDFIDPLFLALDEPSTPVRAQVADAFRKQIPALTDTEKEAVAVRLANKMMGEKQGYALAAYAASLKVFAVKATHSSLKTKADANDYQLGTLAVAILVGSELRDAIKATE